MDFYIYNYSDVVNAIAGSSVGDEINLYFKNDVVFNNQVLIDKTLYISLYNDTGLDNVTISVNGAFKNFYTGYGGMNDNLSLTLHPGIIVNGNNTGGGFLIYGNNCSLTATDCEFKNCYATTNGACIIASGSTLERVKVTLNNCSFTNCSSNISGVVYGSSMDLKVINTIFDSNRCHGGNAINIVQSAQPLLSLLEIDNCTFTNNTSDSGSGGAISTSNTAITINNSHFENNQALYRGGAIAYFGGAGDVSDLKLVIQNTKFIGNTIQTNGGAIALNISVSEFIIENCTITDNVSTGINDYLAGGGAIFLTGEYNNLQIINSTIKNNKSNSIGGAIFGIVFDKLTISGDSIISDNEALNYGGAISCLALNNIDISGNTKIINNIANCNNEPSDITKGGGAIHAICAYDTLVNISDNVLISDNTSISNGGALYFTNEFEDYSASIEININNSQILNNQAVLGGGIYLYSRDLDKINLIINNATISKNSASLHGGGIYNHDGIVKITSSTLNENSAINDGGAIYTTYLEKVFIDNETEPNTTTFSNNTSQFYLYWSLTSGGDSDIHNQNIHTNKFSSFTPTQTTYLENLNFLNAYNNYDINYNKQPIKSFKINCYDYDEPTSLLTSVTINSFINATVTYSPQEQLIIDGMIWQLYPEDQNEKTIYIIDETIDYNMDFYYRKPVEYVTIKEKYISCNGSKIVPTKVQTIKKGQKYTKEIDSFYCYIPLGYKINNGQFIRSNKVEIEHVNENIKITYFYKLKCCYCCCCCCCCCCYHCHYCCPILLRTIGL